MIPRIVARTGLALFASLVLATEVGATPAVVYADLGSSGGITRAAPDDIVRFFISSGGCRSGPDSPPAINGTTIEFTLAFSSGCFATPPGFLWSSDLAAIPPGTYTVKYYQQFAGAPSLPFGPKQLVATRTLIVGPRPALVSGTAPGSLDPSFGTDGVAELPFPGYFWTPVRLVTQQNGQVLVGALTPGSYAVSRLLDSGAIDGNFAGGRTIWPSQMNALAMALTNSDEILLAGARVLASQYQLAIQRYSASGNLKDEIDLSQAALSMSAPVGVNPFAMDVAALRDGRFVVTGISGNTLEILSCAGHWFVALFTASGTLDASFGQGGMYVGPAAGCLNRIVPTPDGGLLGLGTTSDAVEANFLIKLNAAGQPDSSFGTAGVVTGAFARSTPRFQDDGKILIGGPDFSLVRLRSNGSIDTTFGNQGLLANQTGRLLRMQDFLLMADKTILLVGGSDLGYADSSNPNTMVQQPVLTRYNANGTLDRSFGDNGVSLINTQVHSTRTDPTGPAEAMSLAALPNGQALLVAPKGISDTQNRSINLYRFQTKVAVTPPADANYQGLWWNATEPGWGINLAHQGDRIFATWFTYDTSGNALWLSMLADRTSPTGGFYGGDIYVDVGPPFGNYTGAATATKVGSGMLSFTDADTGFFSYSLTAGGATGLAQAKAITRFVLDGSSPQPVCSYSAAPNLGAATNYQDLWWNPGEPGWGINFVHQGDLLFATWYTYDAKGTGATNPPLWLSGLLTRTGRSNIFAGPLNRTSGPSFDSYKPPYATQSVGFANIDFSDGNDATLNWTTNGSGGLPSVGNPQSKTITRFPLAGTAAATTCQ